MTEISTEQQELVQRLQTHRVASRIVMRLIWAFMSEKPEDEPLHDDWADVWRFYRERASRYAPDDIIERIDRWIKEGVVKTDDAVWELRVHEDAKVTFLLGAGASAPSGIPTVNALLPELWKRARKIGREDLDRLNSWCDQRTITNIEDLLTAAYISDFAAKNSNITGLLDYFLFSVEGEVSDEDEYLAHSRRARRPEAAASSISFLQDTLQTLFGLLASTMIPVDPNEAHKAIVKFVKQHKQSSIITTNYDGCIDEAILNAKLRLRGTLGTLGAENDAERGSSVELIKMHGSINWAYCEACQEVREFDLRGLKEAYLNDTLSYPVIGICRACGGQRRPLLVPPLSFKFLMFPPLVDIWNAASQRIDDADYLVIVGYSFSEADTYMTKIISRAMSSNEEQKMVVVNSDAGLVASLRQKFSKRVDGFDEGRILRVCEGCEHILGKLLNSMLGKQERKARAPARKRKAKRA